MRTIKFRGKRVDNGCWVYGDLMTMPIHHACVILENGVINHSVDPETVGQFTGLTINPVGLYVGLYEGDIVEVKGTKRIGKYVTEIIWHECGFRLKENKTYLVDGKILPSMLEIIGNRWDNPELLQPK